MLNLVKISKRDQNDSSQNKKTFKYMTSKKYIFREHAGHTFKINGRNNSISVSRNKASALSWSVVIKISFDNLL